MIVQPIWTLARMPPSPRHTSSTSLPPGRDRKIVRQLADQHQQDMALLAPVVGEIARRVFDHAHADVAKVFGAPERLAGLAGMLRALHAVPIGRAEGYVEHQHGRLVA